MTLVFQEWFLRHGSSPLPFGLALMGLTALYFAFMRKEEYVLFSTGLSTMGVEMLVIFTFQVIYGYIYLKIGAVITAFLGGLLPGAILGNRFMKRPRGYLILSDLVLLGLLGVFGVWVRLLSGELHPFLFLAYGFVFSFFCGFQFPLATRMIGEKKSPAAGCLAADLTGAAVGTLASGTLLIPLWGIHVTTIFLILTKISSNMILLQTKKGPG
jgi:spermidine synthase